MRIFVAILLFLVAGLLGLLQFIAIIDPVGTKMADDGDPFGNPFTPWYQHAIIALIIVACVVIASRLLRRKQAD
jgi:nicotinamide riboside transporter PnuC